jgi:branched-subunit amino acid transport protein AzlD
MTENTLCLNFKEQLVRKIMADNSENNMKIMGRNLPSFLVLMQVGYTFAAVDSTQCYLYKAY